MYLYFIVIYPDSLHGAKSETFEPRHEKTGFLPDFCLWENKGADQLHSNCEAGLHLCFRYTESTVLLLCKSEFSSL